MQMGPVLLPTPLLPGVVSIVDMSCDLSSLEHLASDVFPFPTSGLAVGLWRRFCHRRSHQHPVPSGSASCSFSEDRVLFAVPSSSAAFQSCWPIISNEFALAEAPALSSIFGRTDRPTTVCFRVPLKRCTCFWPKPSAVIPQGPRGQ